MLSETLAYLAARLRLNPADPHLSPLPPAILAAVLDDAASQAAVMERLPLHPSLTQPTPSRRTLHLHGSRLVPSTTGNVVYLVHPAAGPCPRPTAPQDGAA